MNIQTDSCRPIADLRALWGASKNATPPAPPQAGGKEPPRARVYSPPRLRGGRGGSVSQRAGFTLLEVVIALAILATALLVLLDSHFAALDLYDASRQETIERMLLRQALGMAEADLMAGNASGSGDFGKRYPDYKFAYTSTSMGEETTVGLYDVLVTLDGPSSKREMHMLVYYMGSSQ